MMKFLIPLAAIIGAWPAAAQHVGVGVYFGEPGYYEAPPFYDPPVVYAPEQPVIFRMMPADAVFNSLEERGYRDFGPMAFRDGAYKVEATDRRGDRVALELNAVTAEVMRGFVIAQDVAPPARRYSPPASRREAPPRPERPSRSDDPLVIY